MEIMNKKTNAIAGLLMTAAISLGLVLLVFAPEMRGAARDFENRQRLLAEYRRLLAGKPALESEWEKKKSVLEPGLGPDEALNAWIKELLDYAQTQGLSMEKLEPAGIKEGAEGKRMAVFMTFRGDIRKFVRFAYYLMETDPLASIESFLVRPDEQDPKNLSFELMLGKGAL